MSDILRNSPTLEFGVCSMREDPEGMWVTYPSHQQALVAAVAQAVQEERERYRREEVEPLVRALPDPAKLDLLADWFDMEQQNNPGRWAEDGVQRDLRRWANNVRRVRDDYFAAIRSIQAQSPEEEGQSGKELKP